VPLAVDALAAERTWLRAHVECLESGSHGVGLALDLLGESADSPLRTVSAPARQGVLNRLAEVE
jgi:hypothetical protein